MKWLRSTVLLILFLAASAAVRAQFIVTALTDTTAFSGVEQVITFDALANGDPITTQFTGQDVTFSTGLFATTNSGDTNLFPSNGGGVIATNYYFGTPVFTWTLSFASPQKQTVFLVEMNSNDTIQLTTSLGGTTHGSVSRLSPNTTPQLFGVQDLAGFDTLTFTVTGSNNLFFAMDSFRFEAVPEPSSFVLLGLGLAAAGAWRRKSSRP